MLVHPNPMHRTREGWIDSHLGRVEVKTIRVNWGNHPTRWVVYARRKPGAYLTTISKHISEEQAVVSAQTLANRLYRLTKKGKKKPSKKIAQTIRREDAIQLISWLADLAEEVTGGTSLREKVQGNEDVLLEAFQRGYEPHDEVLVSLFPPKESVGLQVIVRE